jgi:hypothetical protein
LGRQINKDFLDSGLSVGKDSIEVSADKQPIYLLPKHNAIYRPQENAVDRRQGNQRT